MYLPKALRCKASATLFGTRQKSRVKEEAEEEDTSQREGCRDPGGADTTPAKDRYRELLHRSQKSYRVTRPAELLSQAQWKMYPSACW